jgi:hypothetical protein
MDELENLEVGLYKGIMGKIICNLSYAHASGDLSYHEKSIELIDRLVARIGALKSTCFSKGLSGVGWGIEWIARQNYIEINTDEVLEEFDDMFFKSVIYSGWDQISLSDGLMGALYYFYSRYTSCNPGTHHYKKIFLEDCLNVLMNRLRTITDEFIESQPGKQLKKKDAINVIHAAYFLSRLPQVVLDNNSIETSFYVLVNFMDHHLSLSTVRDSAINEEKAEIQLLIACGYYLAGRNFASILWQERAMEHIRQLPNKSHIYWVDLISPGPKFDNVLRLQLPGELSSGEGQQFVLRLYQQGVLDFDSAISLLLVTFPA